MATGIQETKDCLTVIDAGAKMIIKMIKEKKFVVDFAAAMVLVQKIPMAIEGISKVPAELKDLDATEVTELTAFVVTDLAFEEGKAQNILSTGMALIASGYKFAMAIKG